MLEFKAYEIFPENIMGYLYMPRLVLAVAV
jgi:hypothetical protein